MCSARRLMVFNVCVKFHENMSSGFKVMEQTRKLLTDTHTHTEKTKTLYPHSIHSILRMPGYNYRQSVLKALSMFRLFADKLVISPCCSHVCVIVFNVQLHFL